MAILSIAQFFAGALLLSQKFSLLGALMFLPIISNIFVISMFYYFAFTPVITGLLLLVNVFFLLWHWNKIKILLNGSYVLEKTSQIEDENVWFLTGMAMLLLQPFTELYLTIIVCCCGHLVYYY